MAASSEAATRKKRLGQYFTGQQIALLLSELASVRGQSSIIDPMVGTGDMLIAARRARGGRARLAGVEIDPIAAGICQSSASLRDASILNRDAFHKSSYTELGWQWDLVITNPPYVRYQNSQRAEFDDLTVPSPDDVRSNLISTLRAHPSLGEDERALLIREASGYSGFADLAVPAWLLCCALTRPGGRIALVVPNTWLSRDYAAPVLRVLEAGFDLLYVVEDRDVAWFKDALVRTTLVVAEKRVAGAPLAHTRLVLDRSAATPKSLVGNAFPGRNPERQFARWASAFDHKAPCDRSGIEVIYDTGATLAHVANSAQAASPKLPRQVRAVVGDVPVSSLADLGWNVGQGMRTGANDFFYLKADAHGTVRSTLMGDRALRIDAALLLPAIRRQADLRGLGNRRSVASADAGWRLLVIPPGALSPAAENRKSGGDLAHLIRVAEKTPGPNGVLIPSLSAVRVNKRSSNTGNSQLSRHWYHLPQLTPRHTGSILVSRVNGGVPTFYANPSEKVIDANFSTLWTESGRSLHTAALLAFLQSSWVQACLECACTVMAGGALKVEATHLRRLPVPVIDRTAWTDLGKLGRKVLGNSGLTQSLREDIDGVLVRAIGLPDLTSSLSELAESQLRRRAGGKS
jgi:hypothetical protein